MKDNERKLLLEILDQMNKIRFDMGFEDDDQKKNKMRRKIIELYAEYLREKNKGY